MGLGKSAQAIVAADAIDAQRILILCPASTRINWSREFGRFSTRRLPCSVLLTSQSELPFTEPSVTICSYDLATTNAAISRALAANSYSLLVLDEAHFLKGVDAKRTHAILAKGGIIHKAKRTWALTGTPTPNHAGEIYPLARCFGGTNLSYSDFIARYCVVRRTPFGDQIVGSRNTGELRALLAPFVLRRTKEEVMKDLPPILFTDLVVEPGPVDEELCFADHYILGTVDKLHKEIHDSRTAIETALKQTGMGEAGLTVLKGMQPKVNSLRQFTGLQKLHPIIRIVSDELEANAYSKIVIFCVHRHMIEGFRQGFSKFKPVTLYGGTAAEKRQKHIDQFVNNPRCRVFIGNIVAAGVGVDGLQKVCDQVLMAECSWVPGENAQAVMRVHRIGQTRPVTVRVVSVADSIDEDIQRTLRRKMKDIVELWD